MKKMFYLFVLSLGLLCSSCQTMVKGLMKTVAKSYNNHTDVNVSALVLTDKNNKEQSLSSLFPGKTIYLYVWKLPELLPPSDQDTTYRSLKQRFERYDDVVFINLYTGDIEDNWQKTLALKNKNVGAYKLAKQPVNESFRNLVVPSTMPLIIGKDGKLLSFSGPRPTDKITVDYALYQARTGQDGTQSVKTLIKGIDSKRFFKNPDLIDWYEKHFGSKPGKINYTISTSSSKFSVVN